MRKLFVALLILTFFGCKKEDLVGASSKEKYKIFNSSNSPLNAPSTDQITCLKVDGLNNIWIGTKEHSNRLLRFSKSTNSWKVFGNEVFGDSIWGVYDLDIDQNNNVWVGTNNGVFKYDGSNWTEYFKLDNPPIQSVIYEIHVDKFNNVWCSKTGDLYKYDGNDWTHIKEIENLNLTQIQKITSDDNGTLWIGFYDGLVKYDGSVFEKIEHKPAINSMNIYDIEIVTPDNIWVGTIGGLHQVIDLNWLSIDSVDFENPLWNEYNWVVSAIAINEETKLFGTWNMGLAINDGDEFHFMRGDEFGIDTNRFQINELEYDLNSNIWMSTRFGDIIVYNENGLK